MAEDLQVVSVIDPGVVAVPQPDIDVVTHEVAYPVVIESPAIEVVTVGDSDHIVDSVHEFSVVTVGEQGPQGIQGPSGSGAAETYTAVTDLGGHRVVVTDSSGGLIYADVTNQAHANQAVRITTQAASAGGSIIVQSMGRMTEASWSWTPGARLYVAANALLTETTPVAPSVFSKVIAVAETATRILIVNEPPHMLL